MILLSQAIEGYLIHAEARSLSAYTIRDYTNSFERFLAFAGDIEVGQISRRTVEEFLQSLQVGKKTKLNYHIGLSALWTWMVEEELVESHLIRSVKRPDPETPAISPFTEQDVKLLLASLERSRSYTRPGQAGPSSHSTPNALRNKVIIFLLLDTGLRASELIGLKIKDVDLRNREIEVIGGKGGKDRFVYISAKTAKLLWRYLATRRDTGKHDPLLTARIGLAISVRGLELMLSRLGKKAGVKDCYPHRFRHTFAISYLRNGGDIVTLQRLLGHSDPAMTFRYLAIAEADMRRRHQSASPVANWSID